MCAGALVHVRIRRVIFGCGDERSGAAGGLMNVLQTSALNHRCQITSGVLQQECASLLHSFFRTRRAKEQAIAAGDVSASASLRRKRLKTGDAADDEGNAE